MCILENGIYSISFFSIQTIKHCIICLTFLDFYKVNVNFIKSKFAKSPKRITQPRSTKQIITLIHCTYLCVFGAKIQSFAGMNLMTENTVWISSPPSFSALLSVLGFLWCSRDIGHILRDLGCPNHNNASREIREEATTAVKKNPFL